MDSEGGFGCSSVTVPRDSGPLNYARRRGGWRRVVLGRWSLVVGPWSTARHYNALVRPLNADTSPEIERQQVEAWRTMTPANKAAMISGLTQAVFALALAGVKQRFPDASPREHFLRLAIITHGRELATKAYPEIAALDLP